MNDLPYKVEYARFSQPQSCNRCLGQFVLGEFRIAAMVQSQKHDGRDPMWYHKKCFFETKTIIKRPDQIESFEAMKYDDQLDILRRIDNNSRLEEIAMKRQQANEKGPDPEALSNYGIEYSTSNIDKCSVCKEEILRNEIRIKKIVFDTDISKTFGKEILWNHLHCFIFQREFYGFKFGGEMLPGFSAMLPDHANIVKEALPSFATEDEVKSAVREEEKMLIDDLMGEPEVELEVQISIQNIELTRVSKALGQICSQEELQLFLIMNDSCNIEGFDHLLDRCADFLTFGALYKCQKCFNGDMIFTKHGYQCNGMINEWVKCGHYDAKPMRLKCVIPDEFKEKSFFATCEPTVSHRAVRNAIIIEDDEDQPTTSSKMNKGTKKTKNVAELTLKDGSAVDPKSGMSATARVYQTGGSIYSAVLGLTDIEKNKNSYFKLQVLQSETQASSFWLFTSWGRIGTEIGDSKMQPFASADQACEEFQKIYEEQTLNDWKSKHAFKKYPGKFYPVDVNYNDDIEANTSVASRLSHEVEELIKILFNVATMKKAMKQFKLDLEKMPLGKLSVHQLQAAYYALAELEDAVNALSPLVELNGLSNKFFTLIPHNFGLSKVPVLDTLAKINEKRELVDSLFDLENAYAMMTRGATLNMNSFDAYYKQLNAEIMVVQRNSEEFKLIETYATNTAYGQNYQIQELFKVNRQGEAQRYAQFKNLHNRQLLWHGSRFTNFTSILSKGMTIGQQVNGSMFGRGLYFADMLFKSAGYCVPNPQGIYLLVLCEVALGTMQESPQAANIQNLPAGYHSVKGVGRCVPNPKEAHMQDGVMVPLGKPLGQIIPNSRFMPNGGLNYNEFIVYNEAQVNIKYLVKMKL